MGRQPSQGALAVKNPAANLGETQSSTTGPGRFPGGGNGHSFQFCCLETPMDGGAWWATVHGVTESDTIEPQGRVHIFLLLHNLGRKKSKEVQGH